MAEKPFRVLTTRTAGTTAQEALYPVLSLSNGETIAWEELDRDKPLQRYCRASGVTVSQIVDGAERPILRLSRLKIDVYVTAGRLALVCKRYRTADALAVAGPGAAFGGMGVTSSREGRRRQGAAMVGHMRYPWIRSVSARPGRLANGRGVLVIEFSMTTQRPMLLRLDLRLIPPRTPAELAAEICQRVVDYWLTYAQDAPPELQGTLVALSQHAATGKKNLSPRTAEGYLLPTWHPVFPSVPFLEREPRLRPPYIADQAGAE